MILFIWFGFLQFIERDYKSCIKKKKEKKRNDTVQMIKIRESLEVLVIFCGSTTDCQLLVDPFNVIFRGSKTSPSEGPFPCDFFFSCDGAWNLCCPNVPPLTLM